MKILLIGNLAPPYEDEGLHNLTLLKKLREDGHDCSVIDISKYLSKKERFVNEIKYYIEFVFKLVRYGWRKDVIHYLTKSYTRPALMRFMTSVLISRIFLAKAVVTIHSEMFSVFAQSRGPTGGAQSIHTAFRLAHKVIFGDKDTFDVASTHYKARNNFELIPLFMHIPEDIKEGKRLALEKLRYKKNVIVFSNVTYPSLLFDILDKMLRGYLSPDTGIAVSFFEKSPAKLERVIKEAGAGLSDNLLFIESDDMHLLSMAYARADIVLRPMSCDGETFYEDFALVLRKPEHAGNYLYFPTSCLLIKEGNVVDLCASIFNSLLMEKTEAPLESETDDFYLKIKDIYFKKT